MPTFMMVILVISNSQILLLFLTLHIVLIVIIVVVSDATYCFGVDFPSNAPLLNGNKSQVTSSAYQSNVTIKHM